MDRRSAVRATMRVASKQAYLRAYTAAIAFLPLFGMVLEQTAVALGLLDASRFQFEFLFFALLALVGTLMVWVAKRTS